MAIQFARIEILKRHKGGNACCKGAYNARDKITDKKSNVTYNFSSRGDNVYHEILLPDHVEKKFLSASVLMNAVEESENRYKAQLLKDVVIALPDDKELSLGDRINISKEIISKMGWVQGGLGVQLDIHAPHEGENNWHAHVLVTTRRFREDGSGLGEKARDMNPEFKTGKNGNFIVAEEEIIHRVGRDIINDYFKKLGLQNRVDEISSVPQEHIGPMRMRRIENEAVLRNEMRRDAHLESIRTGEDVLKRASRYKAILTCKDIERSVMDIPNTNRATDLVREALSSPNLVPLHTKLEDRSGMVSFEQQEIFTTKEVRSEELRILRFAGYVSNMKNHMLDCSSEIADEIQRSNLSDSQKEMILASMLGKGGIRVIRGRTGTDKSDMLSQMRRIANKTGIEITPLAPTHKAKVKLLSKGYETANTVKGFLFAVKNCTGDTGFRSTIVVDDAGMLSNRDLQELLRVSRSLQANLILVGEDRQRHSAERGGMFGVIAEKFGSSELTEARRQGNSKGREIASYFASGLIGHGLDSLVEADCVQSGESLELASDLLLSDWVGSKVLVKNRLILSERNSDVEFLNSKIRGKLKEEGVLKGGEYKIQAHEYEGNDKVLKTIGFMENDRILFVSSNKKLGVSNGQFASLVSVGKREFVAKVDGAGGESREISFDPKKIKIKHGYAVSIFKNHGTEVKEAYIFHNGAGTSRSTYAELTRDIEKVGLYYNETKTRGIQALKSQMGLVDVKNSSLHFYTKEDIDVQEKGNSFMGKAGMILGRIGNNVSDILHKDYAYYNDDNISELEGDLNVKEIEYEQQMLMNEDDATDELNATSADRLGRLNHGTIEALEKRNIEVIKRNSRRILLGPELVIDKLDHSKAVFTREDIEKELEKVVRANLFLNGNEQGNEKENRSLEDLASKESLELDNQVKVAVLGMLDTVLLSPKLTLIEASDLRGRMLFAKTKQVELEKRFEENIITLASRNNHKLKIEEENIRSIKAGVEFTKSQKEVIRSALEGSDISIIEGWPGSGKSTVAKEIARHYKAMGYKVIAAAPTNKAAAELGGKLGEKLVEKVYTTAALRILWQKEKGYNALIGLNADYYKEEQYKLDSSAINNKTVLMLDEISMIGLPEFDYFVSEVVKSGGKLIGLGDNNQHQAIGIKGAARKAIGIAGSMVLTETNRHKNPDFGVRDMHKLATEHLSKYEVLEAISIYDKLGAINILATEEEKERSIAKKYVSRLFEIAKEESKDAAAVFDKIAMSAYTNAEIDRLNVMVRESLKRAGVFSGRESRLISGGVYGDSNLVGVYEGERIIFKSNHFLTPDGYGGVLNNEVGTVKKILSCSSGGKGEFIAEIEGEGGTRKVCIRTGEEKYPVEFKHAYALTNCAIQGISASNKLYSADKYSGYESTLVGLTRHIEWCQIFAASSTLEEEVYRAKDLDVKMVMDEFIAKGYEYVKHVDEDGKVFYEKEDVPLWKIGFALLAFKRSNLNFASDYSMPYVKSEHGMELLNNMESIKSSVEDLRAELQEQVRVIEGFEEEANKLEFTAGGEIWNEKQKGEERYSRFEILAMEHFKVREGSVVFDLTEVMNVTEEYKKEVLDAKEILDLSDNGNLDGAINKHIEDHINALKLGIWKDGAREKIRWEDLREIEQNLMLHSYLDAGEKDKFAICVAEIKKLEEQLSSQASEGRNVWDELGEQAKLAQSIKTEEGEDSKLAEGEKEEQEKANDTDQAKDKGSELNKEKPLGLTGNFAAVRSYIESRAMVRDAHEKMQETDQKLLSHGVQSRLIDMVEKQYGIKYKVLRISCNSLIKKRNKIEKKYLNSQDQGQDLEKSDSNNKAGESKIKQESFKEFLDKYIEKERKGLGSKKRAFGSQRLLAPLILGVFEAKKCEFVSSLYEEVNDRYEQIDEATELRRERASLLISCYNGHIGGDSTQPTISMLISQVGYNYYTIAKHADEINVKFYFEKLIDNTAMKNKCYGIIMEVMEKFSAGEGAAEDLSKLINASNELNEFHALLPEKIEELKAYKSVLHEEYTDIVKAVNCHNAYKHIEFNAYIGYLYKDNRIEIIDRLDAIIQKTTDKASLVEIIEKNPDILGEVKGKGLLARLFGGSKARKANESLGQLGSRIKLYLDGEEKARTYEGQGGNEYYDKRIDEVQGEINALKRLIPSKDEEELVKSIQQAGLKVGIKSEKDYGNEESKVNKGNGDRQEELFDNIYKLSREKLCLDMLTQWRLHTYSLELKATEEKLKDLSLERASGNLTESISHDLFTESAHSINTDGELSEQVPYQGVEEKLIAISSKVANGIDGQASSLPKFTGKLTAKQRFYSNAEIVRAKTARNNKEKDSKTFYGSEFRDYERELNELKQRLKYTPSGIVISLLGSPNARMSNSSQLRYGKKGSLVVNISGNKSGTWYDHESGEGGDLIALAGRERSMNFKDAVEYLKQAVGVQKYTKAADIVSLENAKYINHIKEDEKERQKKERNIKKASELYKQAKNIMNRSIAKKYLKEHRSITAGTGDDIRTTGIWDKAKAKSYPAIISFARDENGKITGGQTISLDPVSARKADIEVVKKSFGSISGSFVTVQKNETNKSNEKNVITQTNQIIGISKAHVSEENPTFIAEGLETALSVKEAGVKGKILCSLGIGNIKNYTASKAEKIVIVADNDGDKASTEKTIDKAKIALEGQGAIVEVVRPNYAGDFNDVLKLQGKDEVKRALLPAIKALESNEVSRLVIREEAERFNEQTEEEFKALDAKKSNAKTVAEIIGSFREENIFAIKVQEQLTTDIGKLSDRNPCLDSSVLDRIDRDSKFLVDHNIIPERQVLEALKDATDIKLVTGKLLKKCQEYANISLSNDVARLKESGDLSALEQSEYKEYSRYLNNGVEGNEVPESTQKGNSENREQIDYINNCYKLAKLGAEIAEVKGKGAYEEFCMVSPSLVKNADNSQIKQAIDLYSKEGFGALREYVKEEIEKPHNKQISIDKGNDFGM